MATNASMYNRMQAAYYLVCYPSAGRLDDDNSRGPVISHRTNINYREFQESGNWDRIRAVDISFKVAPVFFVDYLLLD